MATPKSSSSNRKKDGKRSHRKPKRTWNVYISRSLKSINNHMSMSGRTMKIVNSFVNDLFERIASEAATVVRVNKKRTLGARELQTAVRLVLPADLAKHAMAEGTKATAVRLVLWRSTQWRRAPRRCTPSPPSVFLFFFFDAAGRSPLGGSWSSSRP
ncbi:Histone H2B variant V [Trypanosoma cruzi]|uniref:Histone H2B n=1 Tax=Trypanosoma cruzi TaxID=5693 RepID=A0A2V2UH81_TRYCR|nr:Histone H2B variant V [Trypanosoma cruzi]